MKNTHILFGMILFGVFAISLTTAAQQLKVALIIGNGAYDSSPLTNPAKDAADMADVLTKLGFDAQLVTDADRRQMIEAIQAFSDKLRDGGVALFYYSGHGLQAHGSNYLIPLRCAIHNEADIEFEAVEVNRVLANMETANGSGVNIVMLDACRDNPFKGFFKSLKSGLAQMDAPTGSLIVYATAPNMPALDDPAGQNSFYTRRLLEALRTMPEKNIYDLLLWVRQQVMADTNKRQVPWEANSLTGVFTFAAPPPTLNRQGFSDLDALAAMEEAFAAAQENEGRRISAATKQAYWQRFLHDFAADIASFEQDNQMRQTAQERIAFWANAATPTPIPTAIPSPAPTVTPFPQPTATPKVDEDIKKHLDLFQQVTDLIQANYLDETKTKTDDLKRAAMTATEEHLRQQGISSEEIEKMFAENPNDVEKIFMTASSSPHVSSQELVYAAINGTLKSLDEHSSFMPPDIYKEMQVETRGNFGGVGIQLGIKEGKLIAIAPIDETPAFKAGILAGDHILQINDHPTEKITLMEAVQLLRGAKGTSVTLTIMRDAFDQPKKYAIIREIITIKSVTSKMLSDNIGYIRIAQFQENTSSDLERALNDLKKRKMKRLIVDVRSNPGGLLNACVEVADQFLDRGKLIVYTDGRKPNQDMRFVAKSGAAKVQYPIIVLVDHGTASAAEILTAALQAHARAVIIGTPTYGKGSVQSVIPLSDGSGLRLTTAYYFTPDNKSIHLRGIIPNILAIPKDDQKLFREGKIIAEAGKNPLILFEKTEEDAVLNIAVEIIKKTSSYKWENLIETAREMAD